MANELLKSLTIDGVTFDVGGVTGVKGERETTYRTGNVNITPSNLLFIGTNPTASVSADTRTFWVGKGTGFAWYNTADKLHGQPEQYGIVESWVTSGGVVFQNFHANSGKQYWRYANGTVTDMPGWNQYAPIASPAFTGTPTAPTNGTASTSNTQIATTAFVQNAISRRVPKTVNGGQVANFNLANNSATFKDIWTAPNDGIVIATAITSFAANSTGYRSFGFYKRTSSGATPKGFGGGVTFNNQAGYGPQFGITTVKDIAKKEIVTLRFVQNSGASLAISNTWWNIFYITD